MLAVDYMLLTEHVLPTVAMYMYSTCASESADAIHMLMSNCKPDDGARAYETLSPHAYALESTCLQQSTSM